jgi:hypothetical protein
MDALAAFALALFALWVVLGFAARRARKPTGEAPTGSIMPEADCGCIGGMRECPRCHGRGAGMLDSYDECPDCHDTGEVRCRIHG